MCVHTRVWSNMRYLPVELGGLNVAESVGAGGGEEEDVGRDELVALHPDHVANLEDENRASRCHQLSYNAGAHRRRNEAELGEQISPPL